MPLTWLDTYDIAIALEEHHPEVDVTHVRFTDLWQMVLKLPDFKDTPERSSERILEAIQAAWLDERL